ncbi:MAG TPA: hypothetical protein PLX71_01550 [Phycicoccus sp.]|nr:hypothetical protein [Phycicoccus sp.]
MNANQPKDLVSPPDPARPEDATARPIRRRAVTRGAAWTLPVLAVATAVPAFAASPTCPVPVAAEAKESNTSDRITVTNPVTAAPIPIGTTISWYLQRQDALPLSITVSGMVGLTTTPLTQALSGRVATFVFTTTSVIPAGGTVSWVYTDGLAVGWNYRSRITVSFAGTSLASCGASFSCTSVVQGIFGTTYGTTCPT